MNSFDTLNKYQKLTLISQNLQFFIGFIGIVCNAFSYVIFLRKPLRNHSYAFYSRILALTEIFILIHTMRHWIRIVLKFDMDLLGPLFCRFSEYQPFVFGSTSIWLRNVILIDRVIRIAYPDHSRIIRRKWFQVTLVLILFASSALLHLILPLYQRFERIKSSNYFICYLPQEILRINFVISMSNISLWSLITFIFEFKLIYFLYKSRLILLNENLSVFRDRKFVMGSISVSLTSFFCLIIFAIPNLIAIMLWVNPDQLEAVFTVSLTFAILNCSSLFFINMTSNSIFYNEFRRLLGIYSIRI